MKIIKCDICGKEENKNISPRTIFEYSFAPREKTGYVTASWYGEICNNCGESIFNILRKNEK